MDVGGEIQFHLYIRLTEREMVRLLTQTSALLFLGLRGRQLMKGSLYDKKHNLEKKCRKDSLEMYALWNCSLFNTAPDSGNRLTEFMRCEAYVL